MKLPEDPIMMYSVINTKLRDEYSSLQLLCEDYDVDYDALLEKLKILGFQYDENINQLRQI